MNYYNLPRYIKHVSVVFKFFEGPPEINRKKMLIFRWCAFRTYAISARWWLFQTGILRWIFMSLFSSGYPGAESLKSPNPCCSAFWFGGKCMALNLSRRFTSHFLAAQADAANAKCSALLWLQSFARFGPHLWSMTTYIHIWSQFRQSKTHQHTISTIIR